MIFHVLQQEIHDVHVSYLYIHEQQVKDSPRGVLIIRDRLVILDTCCANGKDQQKTQL